MIDTIALASHHGNWAAKFDAGWNGRAIHGATAASSNMFLIVLAGFVVLLIVSAVSRARS